MPDTATQIRDYYEAIVVRVEPDEILEEWIQLTPEPPRRPAWLRGPAVAVGVAVLLLLLIGVVALLLRSQGPVVEEPEPTTTVVQTTVPGALPAFDLAGLPSFQATIRYADADVPEGEFTAEVVVSYGADGRFRRQIVSVNVPEFHWGLPGEYYVTDGSVWGMVYEGETYGDTGVGPLEPLGPLFWDDWEGTCRTGELGILPTAQIGGRESVHLRCSTLVDDWELWVDAETGLILKVVGEVEGDDFTIGEAFEVVSVEYEPTFGVGLFDVPEAPEPPGIVPSVDESIYFVTSVQYAEAEGPGFESQRVRAVWYLDGSTWREEALTTFAWASAGDFRVWSEGVFYEYVSGDDMWSVDTEPPRSPLDEHFAGWAAECDPSGSCLIWGGSRELSGCDITPELVLARPTTHYSCVYLDSDRPQPVTEMFDIWIDDETGLTLRGATVQGSASERFEVIQIDFDPTFTADLFEQSCPTSTCRSQEEVFADPYYWVTLVAGQAAPSWSGDLVGGGSFDLADLPARPAIFYFWYDYCCLDELAEFQELADVWGDRVEFVAVVLAGDAETTARIHDRGGFTFPMVSDLENEAADLPEIEDAWGVDAVPIWVILDADRRVASVLHWESTRADREAALEAVAG